MTQKSTPRYLTLPHATPRYSTLPHATNLTLPPRYPYATPMLPPRYPYATPMLPPRYATNLTQLRYPHSTPRVNFGLNIDK
jgi:hypothetical protein